MTQILIVVTLPGSFAAPEPLPEPINKADVPDAQPAGTRTLSGGIKMMQSATDPQFGNRVPGNAVPQKVNAAPPPAGKPLTGGAAIRQGASLQPAGVGRPSAQETGPPAYVIKSGGKPNSSQLRGGTMVIEGGVSEDVPRTPEDVTAYLKKMKAIIESYNAVTMKLLMNGSGINTDPEAMAGAQEKTLELVQSIRATVPPEELTEAHGALANAMGEVQGFLGSGDFGNMTSLFRAFGVVQQVHTAMQRYESGVKNCIAFYKLDPNLDPCSGDDAGQKDKLMRGYMELQQNKMAEFQKSGNQSSGGDTGSSGFGNMGGAGAGGGGMPDLGDMMKMLGGMGGMGGMGGGASGGGMGNGGFGDMGGSGGGGGMPNLGDMMKMLGGMGSGGTSGGMGSGGFGDMGGSGGGGGMPNLGDMMKMLGGMGGGAAGGGSAGSAGGDSSFGSGGSFPDGNNMPNPNSMGNLDNMMQDLDSQ